MELPFFLLAHGYCVVFEPAIADGYSAPYQLMVSLSAICSTFLGMLVLVTFLRRHTHDRAIACALLILTLGTNLFFYSTVDSGMPHSYLFLLFCIVLERSDPWHHRPAMNKAVAIGLALGMIALIRPVDVLVGVLPLLWPIAQGGLSKWHLSRSHGGQLVVLCLCAALPILPQIAYWKAATGQWLYWSYEGEGFNWSDPHIIDGLFGFRKGWFVYSPLVLLGFIGLLMMMLRPKWRALAWPVVVYFTLAFYITFSWRSWWYGGGFGCRPMVEALALLALPMAVLAQDLLERNKTLLVAFALVLLAGIHLNRFQQDQYEQTIIHWDSMTRERYWEVWGHAHWDGLKEFP